MRTTQPARGCHTNIFQTSAPVTKMKVSAKCINEEYVCWVETINGLLKNSIDQKTWFHSSCQQRICVRLLFVISTISLINYRLSALLKANYMTLKEPVQHIILLLLHHDQPCKFSEQHYMQSCHSKPNPTPTGPITPATNSEIAMHEFVMYPALQAIGQELHCCK